MALPPTRSLFPHSKLDWHLGKLKEESEANPDDAEKLLDLARALLSRGLFHGGGEASCNQALALARKALGDDPASTAAMIVAGAALVGMERPEAATRYLDQAASLVPDDPALHFAFGALERLKSDLAAAVAQFEATCRHAPEAWEPHLYLGRALGELARRKGNPRRLIERSQFHLVRALQLEPPPELLPSILKDLGISCMLMGQHREAEKLFVRLREHEKYRAIARYHLGQVAYNLGKYNNAIQHYRQYLRDRPDDPRVLGRIARAWFQLGEYPKAREACNQALLLDPSNATARHALGCTLVEEGDAAEALRVFREALKEHPDHMPSYVELARTRRVGGDVRWLQQALEAETGSHDRQPLGGDPDGRRVTRQRIQVLLDELRAVGPSTTGLVLGAIDRTQDEGLRFQLWEAATALAAHAVADATAAKLRDAGRTFGKALGAEALAVADLLPEPLLAPALSVSEDDVKKAAVDRHGPAPDLSRHRRNVEAERAGLRAGQALLLLAIGCRRSPASRALLKNWANGDDADLQAAAWAGLAIGGDPEGTRRLSERARERGAQTAADRLARIVTPKPAPARPRPVPAAEAGETRCTTCGRPPGEVAHLMAGGKAVVCDRCMGRIGQHRRSLQAADDATCDLCARSPFEVRGLYGYNGTHVCSSCLELSLGLLEREEVERFLDTW